MSIQIQDILNLREQLQDDIITQLDDTPEDWMIDDLCDMVISRCNELINNQRNNYGTNSY